MKKNLLAVFLLLVSSLALTPAKAQDLVWGASPFQDSMWSIDTASWTIVHRMAPSLAGFTITGITGVAYDPCEHETYVIMKLSGVSGRVLGKIDLPSGVCTNIGNLGDNFSTIDFREDGQLFGVTGNGASVPETMYLIDKSTGVKTLAAALGSGADGEIICYNRDDNFFYHWSGNGTVVYERVMSVAPYTFTNIPIIGTTSGETFGAMYLGGNKFLISNISSSFNKCNTAGNWFPAFGALPDDWRGLVMPPYYVLDNNSICLGESTHIDFWGLSTDTLIYSWGDGSIDTLLACADGDHTYATDGTYDIHIIHHNACNPADTLQTLTVTVNPMPNTTITPDPAYICSGSSSTVIYAVSDAAYTYQWYQSGSMLGGETGDSLTVTAAGSYNVWITNTVTGCTDSADVGVMADFAPDSISFTGTLNDTICFGDSLTLTIDGGASSYDWFLDGIYQTTTSGNELVVTAGGDWSCVAHYGFCEVNTSADYTVFVLNGVMMSFSWVDNGDGTVTFTNGTLGATSYVWDFGDASPTSTDVNPTHDYGAAGGIFVVTLIASNACFSDTLTDTIDVLVGIPAITAQTSVTVFPNPGKSNMQLLINGMAGKQVEISIVSVSGAVVSREALTVASDSFRYPVKAGIAEGVYIAEVKSGNNIQRVRFSVVR